MSNPAYERKKNLSAICLFVSIVVIASLLLNSIPMALISNRTWNSGSTAGPYEARSGPTLRPSDMRRAAGPQVRLTEVMFDPAGEDAGKEWVSLYNNGTEEADLRGWRLSNDDGEADALLPPWTLPADTTLYVRFGQGEDDSDFEDLRGYYHTRNPFEILNNTADSVALFSGPAGNVTIVDHIGWKLDSNSNYTGGEAGKMALEAGIWSGDDLVSAPAFEEGGALGRFRIEPGRSTAAHWVTGRLLLNEVAFLGVGDNESVELRNPTAASVDSQGWSVKIDGGNSFELPDFLIKPRSVVVLYLVNRTALGDTETVPPDDTDLADGVANLYFKVDGNALGDGGGALGLYHGPVMNDYVSWGTGGSGSVTSEAVAKGVWPAGATVDGEFIAGDSIGRDQFSADTDSADDWKVGGGVFANGPTIGTNNEYRVMIWDAGLDAAAGGEWIDIMNYGTDVNLNGWEIYNRKGEAVVTLPDIGLPSSSTLTVHLGAGEDDLNFSDHKGDWYLVEAGGAAPDEKFFNNTLDILLVTTGGLEPGSVVGFEIWVEGGFSTRGRGDEAWYETVWGWLKAGADWLVNKVRKAVNYVKEGVISAERWLIEKIQGMHDWIKETIKNKVLSWELELGDYLTLSLRKKPLGWVFKATASGDVDIPIPVFPIVKVHLAAKGEIVIEKDCSGLTSRGEITILIGVKVGQSIKKIFYLEIGGGVRFTVTVGDIKVEDKCDPNTHKGHIKTGLTLDIDLELWAMMKLVTPEFVFLETRPTWNIASFDWTQERDYECCRGPRLEDGYRHTERSPREEPNCPSYSYRNDQTYYSGSYSITNGDDKAHSYEGYVTTDSTDWVPDYGFESPGTIGAGNTSSGFTSLIGPRISDIPPTFEPEVTIPPEYPGGEKFAGPGNEVTLNFTVTNLADKIDGFNLTVGVNATDNASLNATMTTFIPSEALNVTVGTDPRLDYKLLNDEGAKLRESGQIPGLYQIRNIDPREPRTFRVVVRVPANASAGDRMNVSFGITSALPNYTGRDRHTSGKTAYLRIGEEKLDNIWSDDLENESSLNEWNWSGDWEWGERSYFPRDGPANDEPGPNIFATNLTGNDTGDLRSVLSTPFFDLSGYDLVNFRFWHWLKADEDIRPELYCNSSGTWYRLKQWDLWGGHPSDRWVYEWFDVTPYLSDEVQFIFIYDTDNYWWNPALGWHIDNLSLVAKGPVGEVKISEVTGIAEHDVEEPGTIEAEVSVKNVGNVSYTNLVVGALPLRNIAERLFFDDFDTDKGWSVIDDDLEAVWNRDSDVNFGTEGTASMNIGGATAGSAGAPGNYGNHENDTLLSPVIDISGARDPLLTFWENSRIDGGADVCELYLSADGGGNWSIIPVWYESDDSEGRWERVEIPLEEWRSSRFRMKFLFKSDARGTEQYMAIDNVAITGTRRKELAPTTDVIPSLAPGEEKNVTLDIDLTEAGAYDLLFFVNCTLDANRSNNYRYLPLVIGRRPRPEIISPGAGENLSGPTAVEMRIPNSTDADVLRGRLFYRPLARDGRDAGDNWTLVGEMEGPDTDMVWSLIWDVREVANGNYEIKAEAENAWGVTGRTVLSVSVMKPEGEIRANFSQAELEGRKGTFEFTDLSQVISGNLEIVSYYWDFGDGAESCLPSPVHTYDKDGSYNFVHSVTGSDGVVYMTKTSVIVMGIRKIPEINVTFDITPETGITRLTDVRFNDTTEVPEGIAINRTWDLGDGNMSHERSPVHRYGELGRFTVNLSLSDVKGHTWSLLRTIEVGNILPTADFGVSTEVAKAGENVTFTASASDRDGEIASYKWSFGDGSSGEGATVVHAFGTPGKYDVKLTVTDNDGGAYVVLEEVTVLESDTSVIRVVRVKEGEIRTFSYTGESGEFVEVSISGNCTVIAARVDDYSGRIANNSPHKRISMYLMLTKTGDLEWANITISFAAYLNNQSGNETINESTITIFYFDGLLWKAAENVGIDPENRTVWANVTHFTIFAAFGLPDDKDQKEPGEPSDGEGKKEDAAWYASSVVVVIVSIVVFLIIVMLVAFFYARRYKRLEGERGGAAEEEEEFDEELEEGGGGPTREEDKWAEPGELPEDVGIEEGEGEEEIPVWGEEPEVAGEDTALSGEEEGDATEYERDEAEGVGEDIVPPPEEGAISEEGEGSEDGLAVWGEEGDLEEGASILDESEGVGEDIVPPPEDGESLSEDELDIRGSDG